MADVTKVQASDGTIYTINDEDDYTKDEIDAMLADKADVGVSYTKAEDDALLAGKADKTDVDDALLLKADKDTTYTKTEVNDLLDSKAGVGDSYTKAEDDALLDAKADKTDVDDALLLKADKADTYTKSEADALLADKADVGDGVPTGVMQIFAGLVPPTGYLLCDGSEVAIADYSNLYTIIGDAYGTASDTDHFVLPDMRECVPKGAGLYGGTVGAHVSTDGLAVGDFLDDRFQGHEHTQYYSKTRASFSTPGGSGMDNQDTTTTTGVVSDGVHGTPRVGDTTEVKSIGVNFIIKY